MTPEEKYFHARAIYDEKDDEGHEVSRLMHQAACAGCVDAMFFLGYYDNLRYWCLPSETALYWFRLAAEKGHPKSAYCLAKEILLNKKYCNFVGFENAKTEALLWLKKAATGNVTAAACILYYIYAAGLWGINADPNEANKWKEQIDKCRELYMMNAAHNPKTEAWDREFYLEDHAFLLAEEDYTKFTNFRRCQ